MCAAIYAKTQLEITDKLAFISPCIAKKVEISDPVNKNYVSYNVTFRHLMNYVRMNGILGQSCEDEIEYGLGAFYPMPGGLSENVRWLLGDGVFIRQLGGEHQFSKFFKKNSQNIINSQTPYLFIDVLNCENGCICGTATEPDIAKSDSSFYNLMKIRETVKKDGNGSAWSKFSTSKERLAALNRQFSMLNLNDYIRVYTDKSEKCKLREPSEDDLDNVFMEMKKYTAESRSINCGSCGHKSCRDMATSIYNGYNYNEGCVYYLKEVVSEEHRQLKYQAEHDALLDMMNRRAASQILRNEYTSDKKYSVLIADIDGFKGLNETYGYSQTDIILKFLSVKMQLVAARHRLLLARYGGDEFLFAAKDTHLDETSIIVREILNRFSEPIPVGEEKIRLSVCIGISNSDGVTTADHHVINAENAMFFAKNKKRNTVFVYSEELRKQALEEAEIKEKLMEAFENDGFYMVYQPKVNLQSNRLSGFEALVRMKAQGLYPGKFIPIAEKNGWIWKIGRITTELTIRQLAKWKKGGHVLYPVSINYSSNQLSDTGYVDFLESLLQKYQIPPKLVEIEITEGVFLRKSSQADELFRRFKEMGIRLLMDDFGTGYSSLAYLTYIPVDVIKLDKSLVDTYLVDGKDSFIRNVIRLVHDLNREMLIEGVEEDWQYKRLCEFKADTIQGYYFSKPIPADEAILFKVSKETLNKS